MNDITLKRPVEVLVVQNVDIILETLRNFVEDQREKHPGHYHNIEYTTDPKEAIRIAKTKKSDVIITGQQLYTHMELYNEIMQQYGPLDNIEDLKKASMHVELKKDGDTANTLALIMKSINPEAWIFRYSSSLTPDTKRITGDIDKDQVKSWQVAEFINSPLLTQCYATRDLQSLKERFPFIKMYDQQKPRIGPGMGG